MKISKSRLALRVLFWGIAAAIMLTIFLFSSQSGSDSTSTSSGLIVRLLKAFYPNFNGMDALAQQDVIDSFQLLVRKGAHFSIYALLGAATSCAVLTHFWAHKVRFVTSFAICAVYAASDEVHQLFIPDRSGAVLDVVIDSCGALLGIAFVLLLVARLFKKHIRQN